MVGGGIGAIVLDASLSLFDDVAVEGAAESFVGRDDDKEDVFKAPHFVVRGLDAVAGIDIGGYGSELVGIGTHADDSVLGTAELGSGDHLHGRSDLLRGADRGDTCADFF